MIEIYGDKDPREIPIYSSIDAFRYLKIPKSTIRSWTVGYQYSISEGNQKFQPLIETKQKKPLRLSFINLIEIHVLRAIRQDHKINLKQVRKALDYIHNQLQISHPLAHKKFQTNGIDLFIEYYGHLINASQRGQITLKDFLKRHLDRIEADESGLAIKLYPFTRTHEETSPRSVVIDPRISFGRLTISETGIPVDVVVERFHAGDSPKQISRDYECDIDKITEAIRCETRPIAA